LVLSSRPRVITVDGPSGAGKGTLSQLLARKLGYNLLDSGALYRLVALAAQNQGIDIQNPDAVADVAVNLNVVFDASAESVRILLDGIDVSRAIREEQIGMAASVVAAYPPVRAALLTRQRAFQASPGLVADGRDMGTCVFPDADIKFFLTASAEARADRRYKQLSEKGQSVDRDALIRDIQERDQRDSTRTVSPLKPADNAILVDSTHLNIDEVLALMVSHIDSLSSSDL